MIPCCKDLWAVVNLPGQDRPTIWVVFAFAISGEAYVMGPRGLIQVDDLGGTYYFVEEKSALPRTRRVA